MPNPRYQSSGTGVGTRWQGVPDPFRPNLIWTIVICNRPAGLKKAPQAESPMPYSFPAFEHLADVGRAPSPAAGAPAGLPPYATTLLSARPAGPGAPHRPGGLPHKRDFDSARRRKLYGIRLKACPTREYVGIFMKPSTKHPTPHFGRVPLHGVPEHELLTSARYIVTFGRERPIGRGLEMP